MSTYPHAHIFTCPYIQISKRLHVRMTFFIIELFLGLPYFFSYYYTNFFIVLFIYIFKFMPLFHKIKNVFCHRHRLLTLTSTCLCPLFNVQIFKCPHDLMFKCLHIHMSTCPHVICSMYNVQIQCPMLLSLSLLLKTNLY